MTPSRPSWARVSEEDSVLGEIHIARTHLPILEAARFSLSDIGMRRQRSFLTFLSIILSIAFFVYLSSSVSVTKALAGREAVGQIHQLMISLVSIIVCGVAITNSMIMSVSERFKEIGTMKCLGALNHHVVLIFLIEGFILGAIGGTIGGLSGSLAGLIMGGIQFGFEKLSLVPLGEIFHHAAMGVAAALTLSEVGSIYPAYFAARLSPTEALRFEP